MLCITSVFAQTRGNATYYSRHSHGRRMSNGLRYHRDSMTCAHKSYPLGTLLRVKNPQNGAEIVVRVTDRGPYARNRMIDLSYAAAKKLGILAKGVSLVEVEPYKRPLIPYRMEEEISQFELEFTDNLDARLIDLDEFSHKPKKVKEKIKAEIKPVKIVIDKNEKGKK